MARLSGLAVTLLAVAALTGCGAGASGEAPSTTPVPGPVRTVYAVLPSQGPALAESEAMVDAIRLVLEERRKRADQTAVRLVRVDPDRATGVSHAGRCAATAHAIVADPATVAVIGTYDSPCTAAALPILNRALVPLVAPVNTDPAFTRTARAGQRSPYTPSGLRSFVRIAPVSSLTADALVELAERRNRGKLYIVDTGSRASRALASGVVRAARGRMPVVRRTRAGRGAAEDRAIWRAVAATGADAVLFAGSAPDGAGRFLRARTVLGKAGDDVLVLGGDALFRAAVLRAAGEAANGLRVVIGVLPPEALTGRGAAFVDRYVSRYGQPGTYGVYAAESAGLLLDAIDRSDGTRASVRRALFATRRFDGLLGRFSVTPSGETTLHRAAVVTVDGGRFRLDGVVELDARARG